MPHYSKDEWLSDDKACNNKSSDAELLKFTLVFIRWCEQCSHVLSAFSKAESIMNWKKKKQEIPLKYDILAIFYNLETNICWIVLYKMIEITLMKLSLQSLLWPHTDFFPENGYLAFVLETGVITVLSCMIPVNNFQWETSSETIFTEAERGLTKSLTLSSISAKPMSLRSGWRGWWKSMFLLCHTLVRCRPCELACRRRNPLC